jgi:hypothetical protein
MMKWVRRSGLAVAGVLLLMGVTTAPASANATGYSNIDNGYGISIGGLSFGLPLGYLQHTIESNGTLVTKEYAAWNLQGGCTYGYCALSLCNWRIDFININGATGGVTLKSRGYYSGCSHAGTYTWTPSGGNRYVSGKSCAVLYAGGVEVTRQCHSVY